MSLQFRDRAFSPNPDGLGREFSLDTIPLEYPVYGNTDFRSPALEVFQSEDGSRILNLRFKDHQIVAGKPSLAGLPATWVEIEAEAETLIIGLEDSKLDLRVELSYTAFADHPAIARSARIVHRGTSPLTLRRACPAQLIFPRAKRRAVSCISPARICASAKFTARLFARASSRSRAAAAQAAINTIHFSL